MKIQMYKDKKVEYVTAETGVFTRCFWPHKGGKINSALGNQEKWSTFLFFNIYPTVLYRLEYKLDYRLL